MTLFRSHICAPAHTQIAPTEIGRAPLFVGIVSKPEK